MQLLESPQDNPFKPPEYRSDVGSAAEAIATIFWTKHRQADRQLKLRELTKEQRCKDPWLSHVLKQLGMAAWTTKLIASCTAYLRATQVHGCRRATTSTTYFAANHHAKHCLRNGTATLQQQMQMQHQAAYDAYLGKSAGARSATRVPRIVV